MQHCNGKFYAYGDLAFKIWFCPLEIEEDNQSDRYFDDGSNRRKFHSKHQIRNDRNDTKQCTLKNNYDKNAE